MIPLRYRLFAKIESFENPEVGTMIIVTSRNPFRRFNAAMYFIPAFAGATSHKIRDLETLQMIADSSSPFEAMSIIRATQDKDKK